MVTEKLPPVAEWPRMAGGEIPYLCLIRDAKYKQRHGFLLAGNWDVNLGYVFDGGTGFTARYDSEAALLADGWTVD